MIRSAGFLKRTLDQIVVIGGDNEQRRLDLSQEMMDEARLIGPRKYLPQSLAQQQPVVLALKIGSNFGEIAPLALFARRKSGILGQPA